MANIQLLTGSLELMAVSDGSQLEIRMGTSGNRTQYYDDAGNHFPDYEKNAEVNSRPKFYPIVTDTTNNQVLAINAGSGSWYYNGAKLRFGTADSNGVQTCVGSGDTDTTFAGMFTCDQYEVATGIKVPRLTVVKNLASSTNDDSDTIEFKGAVNLSGGTPFDITVSSYINISRLAAGTTDAISIYAVDGQEFDYESSTSDNLRFEPYIIAGNIEQGNSIPDGFELKISGQGVYGYSGGSVTDTALTKTVPGGTKNYVETINQDQINDEGILIFELVKDGKTVASAAIQLYDNGDPDNVNLSATATKAGTTRTVTKDVKDGEVVTVTATVTDRATGADKTNSYNTFAWYVLAHNGQTAAAIAGLPAANAGAKSMTLTYAEIKANGGVFVACSCSKSSNASIVVDHLLGLRAGLVNANASGPVKFDKEYFKV